LVIRVILFLQVDFISSTKKKKKTFFRLSTIETKFLPQGDEN